MILWLAAIEQWVAVRGCCCCCGFILWSRWSRPDKRQGAGAGSRTCHVPPHLPRLKLSLRFSFNLSFHPLLGCHPCRVGPNYIHIVSTLKVRWTIALMLSSQFNYKGLFKFFLAMFTTLIRSIKHRLTIKLITRMDEKLRDESIKPN